MSQLVQIDLWAADQAPTSAAYPERDNQLSMFHRFRSTYLEHFFLLERITAQFFLHDAESSMFVHVI